MLNDFKIFASYKAIWTRQKPSRRREKVVDVAIHAFVSKLLEDHKY